MYKTINAKYILHTETSSKHWILFAAYVGHATPESDGLNMFASVDLCRNRQIGNEVITHLILKNNYTYVGIKLHMTVCFNMHVSFYY